MRILLLPNGKVPAPRGRLPACSALLTPAASTRLSHLPDFDPDGLHTAIQDSRLEHLQLERGRFEGRIAHSASTDSRIDWGAYRLSLLSRGQLSPDRITLTMAVGGQGDWRVHGREAAVGDVVVFAEGGELLAVLPPQAQWLSLQLPRERLENAGLVLPRCPVSQARRVSAGLAPSLAGMLSDLAPVLSPAGLPAHTDPQPEPAAHALTLAHEQLCWALLSHLACHSPAGDTGSAFSPGERWQVVRRAEQYLRECDSASVRIEDLCRAACTSLSRLERAFRETFGVSPRRYLTLLRLAAVRRELLRHEAGASVTQVATRWGFFHLGRFGQDYKAQFGESPSQTLRAAG